MKVTYLREHASLRAGLIIRLPELLDGEVGISRKRSGFRYERLGDDLIFAEPEQNRVGTGLHKDWFREDLLKPKMIDKHIYYKVVIQ